eukprot:6729122-Prymnesium_polylepis.1
MCRRPVVAVVPRPRCRRSPRAPAAGPRRRTISMWHLGRRLLLRWRRVFRLLQRCVGVWEPRCDARHLEALAGVELGLELICERQVPSTGPVLGHLVRKAGRFSFR